MVNQIYDADDVEFLIKRDDGQSVRVIRLEQQRLRSGLSYNDPTVEQKQTSPLGESELLFADMLSKLLLKQD
jgi:hypothetical protein